MNSLSKVLAGVRKTLNEGRFGSKAEPARAPLEDAAGVDSLPTGPEMEAAPAWGGMTSRERAEIAKRSRSGSKLRSQGPAEAESVEG